MTDCKCIERTYGRPRPEGSTAHTLACLLETPDLHVVGDPTRGTCAECAPETEEPR